LHRAHKDKATIIGVSQNPKGDTAKFLREYGISFRILLDDPNHYTASNAYGLTNVPSIFLIPPAGEIEVSCVGWSRRDLEEMNRRLAEAAAARPAQLFHRGEDVIDWKAG
jgi:peroxiredoxin